MRNEKYYIRAILLFFPALTIVWGLFLTFLSGPFYISRSDPEYVYLLNGMNVALIEFDRIGHADHPGTPFQLLTGIFIRIIYWISGEGSLVEDVISHPEKYLSMSSFFLSIITAVLFYRISALEYKRSHRLFGALIIPTVYYCYLIIIDIAARYNPDRFLMIIILLFTLICIQYFYLGLKPKKFALFSGFLMATGLATKINFLPFIILPVFLIEGWKRQRTYGISFSITLLVFFAVMHHKFSEFWSFTSRIVTHEGLHGTGEENILNTQTLFDNFLLILSDNFTLVFILLMATLSIVYLLIKIPEKNTYRREFNFILGFLVVSTISMLIIAKHYKNAYMIPILSSSALVTYFIWEFSRKLSNFRYIPHILLSAAIVFIIVITAELVPRYHKRVFLKEQEHFAHTFIRENIASNDYFFIEPSWLSGPMETNALVYGISYINNKRYYFNDYEKIYPNIITYEGPKDTLKHFRIIEADIESLLKSGTAIYMLSTPDRHADELYRYLDSCAYSLDIALKPDTVYSNDTIGQHILKIENKSAWQVVQQVKCGFEFERANQLLSDDGQTVLTGAYQQTNRRSANGKHSLMLEPEKSISPAIHLLNVHMGDYILISIKRQRGTEALSSRLITTFNGIESGKQTFSQDKKLSTVHSHWELVRLHLTIDEQPIDSILHCFFQYDGASELLIDDFNVHHFSNQHN